MQKLSAAAATVHHLHDLFSQGALDGCLDMATDDIEINLLALGQTFRGREGFLQFMQSFKVAFPDIKIRAHHYVGDGDEVVVEASWDGTHTGPLVSPGGSIPPTGNKVTGARFCEVYKLRDGKIARFANYQDVSSWMRQLGLAQ